MVQATDVYASLEGITDATAMAQAAIKSSRARKAAKAATDAEGNVTPPVASRRSTRVNGGAIMYNETLLSLPDDFEDKDVPRAVSLEFSKLSAEVS